MGIETKSITIKIVTIISVLLFIISSVSFISTYKADTDNKLAAFSQEHIKNQEAIDKLQDENINVNIKLARIEEKLNSTLDTLGEIKLKLR